MNFWTTEINAINPVDGQITIFRRPLVPGEFFEDAENFCQENGLGYCMVTGKFEFYVPLDEPVNKLIDLRYLILIKQVKNGNI